jgi:hypothetical protein
MVFLERTEGAGMNARFLAVLALAAGATLAACSSSKTTTVQTRNGAATVTTSRNGQNVTVQTSEGTTSLGSHVDLSKLGVPVYPGAQADAQGTITTKEAQGTSVVAAFKTADSFDKVYEYYKGRLPAGSERMKVISGNGSVASFQVGSPKTPDEVTVQVSSDKPNETDLLITHAARVQR